MSSSLRVTHIFKTKGIGGCERLLIDLLPALRALGIDAAALVLAPPGGAAEPVIRSIAARGVPVQSVPIRTDWDPGAAGQIAGSLHRRRPHVVNTHLIHADLHGVLAARMVGVPALVGSRHNLLTDRSHNRIIRVASVAAARATDRIITVSDAVAAAAHAIERVPLEKVKRIYSGVVAPDRPSPRPSGAVGVACRLMPAKGVHFLVRAWAGMVRPPEWRLLIAGDGPALPDLRDLSKRLGVEASVDFLGLVDDTAEFYRRVSLLVQPSLSEGLGLSAVEAAAAGLPVVASDVGGLREAIVDGKTGLLVDAGNPPALGAAVSALLRDPQRLARMGCRARARAREMFSFDRMVREMAGVYAEVVEP